MKITVFAMSQSIKKDIKNFCNTPHLKLHYIVGYSVLTTSMRHRSRLPEIGFNSPCDFPRRLRSFSTFLSQVLLGRLARQPIWDSEFHRIASNAFVAPP